MPRSKLMSSVRLLSRKDPHDSMDIVELLTLAKELRADLFLDFLYEGKVLFQGKGACIEVDEKNLRVYLREKLAYTVFKGMDVHGYFTLRSRRKSLPCDFYTKLVGTAHEEQDNFLVLATPTEMGHHQRRFNVRISIKKEEIEGLKIWIGIPRRKPEGPKVQWVLLDPEHTELHDISASGLHVSISATSPVYPHLTGKSIVLINGNFTIKEKTQPLTIAGTIVRLQESEDKKWKTLGVGYRQWAKNDAESLRWVSMTTEDGVNPLASWVFQSIVERAKLDRDFPGDRG